VLEQGFLTVEGVEISEQVKLIHFTPKRRVNT
jgi:hypothetical protein